MKHLDNQLAPKKRPPRESWKALKRTGRFYFQCRDREYWEKMKVEDPYSQVKALGIQPGQFQAWLDARADGSGISQPIMNSCAGAEQNDSRAKKRVGENTSALSKHLRFVLDHQISTVDF